MSALRNAAWWLQVFPWLGTWTSRGVIVPDGYDAQQAWRHYQALQEPMDLFLVHMYSVPTPAEEMCPQDMYALTLRPFFQPHDPGLYGEVEVFQKWRAWLGHLEEALLHRNFTLSDPGQHGDVVALERFGL